MGFLFVRPIYRENIGSFRTRMSWTGVFNPLYTGNPFKFVLCQTVKTHNDEMPPSRSALFAIKGKNIPQEQKYIIIGKF